jgi:hypothetical protein
MEKHEELKYVGVVMDNLRAAAFAASTIGSLRRWQRVANDARVSFRASMHLACDEAAHFRRIAKDCEGVASRYRNAIRASDDEGERATLKAYRSRELIDVEHYYDRVQEFVEIADIYAVALNELNGGLLAGRELIRDSMMHYASLGHYDHMKVPS